MRILLALVLAALAGSAFAATTTTSTSTSTTTTLAAGSAWSCVIDGKTLNQSFYWNVGHCVATGAYGGSGGDAIGSAATAAATAAAVCGGNSSLVMLLTTQEPGGAVVPATCGFDMTTWKYVCSNQATADASVAMVESTIIGVVMSPFKFLAICK